MSFPACLDCEHIRIPNSVSMFATTRQIENLAVCAVNPYLSNPVSGRTEYMTCAESRDTYLGRAACGPFGKKFSPKPPKPPAVALRVRILNVLRRLMRRPTK